MFRSEIFKHIGKLVFVSVVILVADRHGWAQG